MNRRMHRWSFRFCLFLLALLLASCRANRIEQALSRSVRPRASVTRIPPSPGVTPPPRTPAAEATLSSTATPVPDSKVEAVTATGLSPEENVAKFGIPAEIVPFNYPLPEGMLADAQEREAMIAAKVAQLEEWNRRFWGPAPGGADGRLAAFDRLWSEIDRHFVGFNRLETDWDAFRETYRPQMAQAESYGEYASIISRMAYSLHDAHAHLIPSRMEEAVEAGLLEHVRILPPSFLPTMTNGSGIGACYSVTFGGRRIVDWIWPGSPNPYRLQPGDEFVGYNGVPWEEWIPNLERTRLHLEPVLAGTASSRAYLLQQAGMFNAHLFETIQIRRVASGQLESLAVTHLPLEEFYLCPEWARVQGLVSLQHPGRVVSVTEDEPFLPAFASAGGGALLAYGLFPEGNIGYIAIKNTNPGNPRELAEQFEQLVLAMMTTDGLILDLRANRGGKEPDFFYPGLAHLVRGTQEQRIFGNALRDPESSDRTRLVPIHHLWGEEMQMPPTSEAESRALWHFYRGTPWGKADVAPFPADSPDLSYDRPIIVLTGPNCVSGGDWLAQLFVKLPGFTLIGLDPAGSNMSGVTWRVELPELEESVLINLARIAQYYVDEQPIDHLSRREGLVSEQVWLTKADARMGTDTVLEYALALVRAVPRNDILSGQDS